MVCADVSPSGFIIAISSPSDTPEKELTIDTNNNGGSFPMQA